jgi:hypothetical protein
MGRFLGMANYYHKFIPNLAHVGAPLDKLRKKGTKFCWGPEQQEVFLELNQQSHSLPF